MSFKTIEPHLIFNPLLQSRVKATYEKAEQRVIEKGLLKKPPNLRHSCHYTPGIIVLLKAIEPHLAFRPLLESRHSIIRATFMSYIGTRCSLPAAVCTYVWHSCGRYGRPYAYQKLFMRGSSNVSSKRPTCESIKLLPVRFSQLHFLSPS